ncbi:MAG: Spy/CpxP family protein refolding chaperone [Gammaproteobacteria bacterium]|nr:Spy/CpxP family protein refolding chaperone [Gammaproteobacteria bacterium]
MKLLQTSFAKRALMVGLIAGSGILAASTFAMPAGGAASKEGCEARHGQKAHGNRAENRAGHLAELKEKLKLTPAQAAAWDSFASARQPGMRQGVDGQAMRGEFEKLTTPQRLDKMLAMSEVRRARMVERAQATKAFYAQLTPEQQTVFDAEAAPGRHRGHGGKHHHQS